MENKEEVVVIEIIYNLQSQSNALHLGIHAPEDTKENPEGPVRVPARVR